MSIVAPVPVIPKIDYPESDGEPMAETDLHRREMNALIEALAFYYRHRPDVYVAGNLFVYYEEGDPHARFAPDVFVVFGVPRHDRRSYRLWEEGQSPAFVIEVSSRKTWLEDVGNKKALCVRLGVAEYFLYDPAGEYLEPPLQGFRLDNGDYRPVKPDAPGVLTSQVLGLQLRREAGRLVLIDPTTGERLLRPDEALQAHQEAEARATAAEQEARREAEARAAAEAELERLRAELDRLRGSGEG